MASALLRARGFEFVLGLLLLLVLVVGELAPVAVGVSDEPSAKVSVRKDTFAPAVPQLYSYSEGSREGQNPVPEMRT